MLGDDIPLFFPVFIVSIVLWLAAEKIDNYCKRFSPAVEQRLTSAYRLLPIIMTAWLIIVRMRAIITRDMGHVEVAKRLQDTEYAVTDLRLLMTGDGVGELSLLALLIFALWTFRLPSIRDAPHYLRKSVQTKVMQYVAACTMLTFWIFFPESNYYAPETYPTQVTMSADGEFEPMMVIFTTLMLAFSGELFAIVALQAQADDFTILQRRALLKTYIVSGIVLLGLSSGNYLKQNWAVYDNNQVTATILFLSQALILALICIPGKRTDNLLKVGEARTKSFAVIATLSVIVLLIVNSILLAKVDEFASGNRYFHEALWLTASFMLLLAIVQILPRYGFDAAARPEYWWLRILLIFSPALIFWFNHLAIFLLPALWIIASFTILVPNQIERDARSPAKHGLIVLVSAISLIIVITASTSHMLGNFLTFGPILLIISNIVSLSTS